MLLSRAQCAAMRGLAILAIMLHNYCHWTVWVKENEYTYDPGNNWKLWHILTGDYSDTLYHLLSYFGHYGVPVFIFLSGYGLVRKYENPDRPDPAALPVYGFMRYNYLKLLRILVPGFVLFVLVDSMLPGGHAYPWINVVGLLTMTVNFFPEPHHAIWPGPYWFFGLMMQYYLIYRLLIYRRSAWTMVALVVICWLPQVIVGQYDTATLNALRYTAVSNMPAFCMGVAASRLWGGDCPRQLSRWQWAALAVAACGLTFAMCMSYQSWLWASVAVVVAVVALVKAIPERWLGWLGWVGGISAAVFVVHPTLRRVLIWDHRPLTDSLLLYILLTLALSWAMTLLIAKIPKAKG